MANPRLAVAYDEIDAICATFKADDSTITYNADEEGGSAQVGLAVTLTAATADMIELVADAEFVLGKLIKVEADNIATVQIGGMMTLPGGVAATLTRGKGIVGAVDGSANEGYIRECGAAAGEYVVQRGFIVEPTTTTAVWVYL